jgi:hypothetical protein
LRRFPAYYHGKWAQLRHLRRGRYSVTLLGRTGHTWVVIGYTSLIVT